MILVLLVGLVVGAVVGAVGSYLFLRQNKEKAARISGVLNAWDAGAKKK
jgi:gas vesicle protein